MKREDESMPSPWGGRFKGSYKWLTFGIGVVCLISAHVRSYTYLTYDLGLPDPYIPTVLIISRVAGITAAVTRLLTLVLGIITLPTWQGFFALAVVVWTFLVALSL